jgi:signal transduction histidine kinase
MLLLGYALIGRVAFTQHSTALRAEVIDRAQDAAHVLLTAPDSETDAILAAASDAEVTLTLEDPSAERQHFLEKEIAPYARNRRPWRLPYVIEGDDGHWRVNVPLRDRRWLIAESHPTAAPNAEIVHVTAAFAIGAIVIALTSSLVLRRVTRPLRALEGAALHFARDLDAQPLPEQGPTDIRRVTHAFNQMQEQLRRYVSDRTTMLAAISHDLRSPLQRLKFRADFMGDDEQREKMLRDLRDMETMIAATLDFARSDADAEPTMLNDLSGLLSTVAEDLTESGYRVAVENAPPRLLYPCRVQALRRAIENLALNAAKYGGAARLSLRTDSTRTGGIGGVVVITVDDDGPGLPADELERVFTPFYRKESSRNTETGGTGLGLSIARSIARGHGGDIVLVNRPGGGLTARLSLPPAEIL